MENGIFFEKTHDIAYLLGLLSGADFTFAKQEDLTILAGTVTSWKEGSRYGRGIRTSVNTVRRIHNIYDDILNEFLSIQERLNSNLKES